MSSVYYSVPRQTGYTGTSYSTRIPTTTTTTRTSFSTSPSTLGAPPVYPRTPAALPGYLLASYNQRREAANSDLQNALARAGRGRGRYNIGAQLQRDESKRTFNRSTEDMLREYGGEGVAKFGLTAGRSGRRLAEDYSTRLGEIDFELANNIQALEDMVREAQIARDRELAALATEEALARSQASSYMVSA